MGWLAEAAVGRYSQAWQSSAPEENRMSLRAGLVLVVVLPLLTVAVMVLGLSESGDGSSSLGLRGD